MNFGKFWFSAIFSTSPPPVFNSFAEVGCKGAFVFANIGGGVVCERVKNGVVKSGVVLFVKHHGLASGASLCFLRLWNGRFLPRVCIILLLGSNHVWARGYVRGFLWAQYPITPGSRIQVRQHIFGLSRARAHSGLYLGVGSV